MKHTCSNIYRHHCTILRQVLQLVGQLWHDSWLTGRILVHGPIENMVDELVNFWGFQATNVETHKLIVHIVIVDKLFEPTGMQLIECLYNPVESKACILNCINKFPLHDWSLFQVLEEIHPASFHDCILVFCGFFIVFLLYYSSNFDVFLPFLVMKCDSAYMCNCMIIILQRMW